MQAEVKNPRWRLTNRNTYKSACTQRSFTNSKAISMFSRSRNSMELFFILRDASGSQKSKMAAYKKGNTHFSVCIQHICRVLIAEHIYPRHESSIKLFSILCDASGDQKSKMVAHTLKILTTQLVYNVTAKFLLLNIFFQGSRFE